MKLTVRIKVVTHDTVRRDKLRKEFPCFITIQGNHNHRLSSASALSENKVLPQTKATFERYFAQGEKELK